MKKLTTILCAGLITASAFAFETNPNKYIPEKAEVLLLEINGNGIPDLYWWDKNQDGVIQNNEIFLDLNEDGIPDISYKELIRMYQLQDKSYPRYRFRVPMVMK